ncbi:beta-ketoacyl synthase N-terminal-like domain-containing protein, partial [Janthinobacterium sp.]|uniref:beta-ketoacyl synthase N-terminal-like domain-containing protein n=1 Tax=Janthinobacterium sp. TaxID=1871054 RepID=UPI002DBD4C76
MKATFSISSKHPVIEGHLVHGRHLLPGLAYIDMLYQLFRKHGHDYRQLELRNMVIYVPLLVAPGSAMQLTIDCEESKPGSWDIAISSHVAGGAATRHAKAQMHRVAVEPFEDRLDLQTVRQDALRVLDMDEVYAQCRNRHLQHSPYMRALGSVHALPHAVLVEAALGRQAEEQASGSMFHPVLIDGSAVGVAGLQPPSSDLHVPLFYASFRATSLLGTRCITRILSTSVRQSGELFYSTLEFFDMSGRKVAELRDCANKFVRHAGLLDAQSAPALAPFLPQAAARGQSTGAIEGLLQRLIGARLKQAAHTIPLHAGYYEMGLGSADLLEVVATLNGLGQLSLTPTLLFEYPNIAELAAYLTARHAQDLLGDASPDAEAMAVAEPAPPSAPSAAAVPSGATRAVEPSGQREDIAIIGLAGRYPHAANVHQFWENLKNGKDCISEIPAERWDHSQYFDPDRNREDKTYSKWGGFIDGVDEFDPLFFNIPPRHAAATDPQERLFLQCAYATLEDAGYTRAALASQADGNVGVFVGVMYEEYHLYGAQEQARGSHLTVGGNLASVANRVSYFCDFNGPSMVVNTMCSSSLTALQLACQSLQTGACQLALAGGVNLSLHPNKYLMLGQGRFVSSKGQCESFGEGGDGYVPAEGVGAVLLKPLAKAIADGDHIYGVIKAVTLNHGGKANGYTVPSPVAQSKLMMRALREAGIDARDISYVEAHGTGTSLGDPIEIAGLSRAFREQTPDRQFCAIGSAKSNIGHCESAAGIAGLTKVLLQMRHGQLAPSLHSAVLNPHIDFAASPFVVQQELAEWKRPTFLHDGTEVEGRRIAGVSSFGAGGSNACVLVAEHVVPPRVAIAVTQERPALIVLSAKNEAGLRAQALQLAEAIDTQGLTDADLADIAYTLQIGREAMEERLALLALSVEQLQHGLLTWLEGDEDGGQYYRGQVKRGSDALDLLGSDEDMACAIATTVQSWLAKGKHGKLLELWVRGLAVDWHHLYAGWTSATPRRISLPSYPFAKERYWVPPAPVAVAAAAVTAPAAETGAREALLLSKAWEAADAARQPRTGQRLAILACAQTAALAAQLAQRHAGSIVIDGGKEEELHAVRDWRQYDAWVDLSGCASAAPAALAWITPLQQWIEARRQEHGVVLCI